MTRAPCHLLYCVQFMQAVCEEAPEAKVYGSRTKGKQRFLAGVVTPAQPHYLYGLLDANQDPHLGMAPPILGIAASAGGYQVLAVSKHADCVMAQSKSPQGRFAGSLCHLLQMVLEILS